ncbi:MAG: GAF domain-containing protein, partial [Rhodospirillaceae bacterium]|nr:GAF domain-containing protein [Rhodospirillaceae bacterium]
MASLGSGPDSSSSDPATPGASPGASDDVRVALTAAMARVAEGDFDTQLPSEGDDSVLFDAFNAMLASIRDEAGMLETVKDIAGELNLDALLQRIIAAVTGLLNAERSSLFLFDQKTDELFSRIAEGVAVKEIRFPSNAGIAGNVFTSGTVENILDVYDDQRFNREIDRATGYRTRSMLCMPIWNKAGEAIGVAQVLNKRDGGGFSDRDESRLGAFTAQLSIALENAQLFEDVNNAKTFNENILKSLSSGVATFGEDGQVISANEATARILKRPVDWFPGKDVIEMFGPGRGWLSESIAAAGEAGTGDIYLDRDLVLVDNSRVSVNISVVPLLDSNDDSIGFMVIMDDITQEKRLKSTMVRYMTKEVAEKLLESGESALGGTAQTATVLFSDIRGFTTISEDLGARDTVAMLNDYFTGMVDVILKRGGMLDKYIGDAIMAIFGVPFPGEEDAANAFHVANEMIRVLNTLNDKRIENGHDAIRIGVGLNTGDLIAGNIGSPKRMDYTVIGDSVNLAARLEGATKSYGVKVLLSQSTLDAL